MHEFSDLEIAVLDWAEDRGILSESDAKSQTLKFFSEAGELADAVNAGNQDDIEDALGDVLVTLILTAFFTHHDLTSCLASAYKEIRNRKGKIVNGVFVKENETPS